MCACACAHLCTAKRTFLTIGVCGKVDKQKLKQNKFAIRGRTYHLTFAVQAPNFCTGVHGDNF